VKVLITSFARFQNEVLGVSGHENVQFIWVKLKFDTAIAPSIEQWDVLLFGVLGK